ncbi:glycohydrolase toxin TNT-related protein [Bacteroides heparinolyticus]|uniref:TNT domain-containing protein n=1 Tax=Prevotella heparinolytica TaxID=28113 RepID=UPI0035A1C8C7
MANNIIFDESHYFMCTNGLKPARMKSNQTVLYREDGNYYLTVYSLKCKGLDFSCRWAALVMAIVGAVIALLFSCPAGWVLLAALGGAAAGACLGTAICGDMAGIMRIWVVIKADASISGYDMVSNKMTPQLECGVFSGVISYVPNVKTVFDEYFIFAYNILGAGLEGFMYAYAFRGARLLLNAPKTFLCNFAANFLKSWSLTGVVFRGAFAEIARRDTYYNSETEGHDREKENTAFAKAFFFERAVAENIHEAVTSDEENAWKKGFNIAKSVAPVLLMGGIQGGKKVGNKILDATQSDVVAAAKETVPAKIAEQVKKGINAAKEYRTQLRSQSKGTGAEEINRSWYNQDGSMNWPPNDGAISGTEKIITLEPNMKLGRYGEVKPNSCYTTETGVNPDKLSLPPTTDPTIYSEYIVRKPIPNTTQAKIAPWGDSPGGGKQYKLAEPISKLEEQGYIQRIK